MYKLLFIVAIILALFNYRWELVTGFLIVALILVILYLRCHLSKKYHLFQSELYLRWSDALRRSGVYTAESVSNNETYIVFDGSDMNILESKNVRSVTKDREDGLIITPLEILGPQYDLETLGIDPEDVTIRSNRLIINFSAVPQGLVAVKVTSY
ncbi:MAG: hypothetical protein AB7F64_09605 [Gammaproteobacteria bacterium]